MEGNLVIVESPTKAATIQKFLGKDFTVKSSRGHIRDLKDKNLSIDVDGGFEPQYVIPADKKKLVTELKQAAKDASAVWLASDEDREGEAISWHLAQTLGLDPSKAKRIVFHEITKDAILNALKNPRNIDMGLVNAQQARRVLDRLVGFELSPVLWRKIQRGLSAGRVQSVALRLVVDREREITAFESKPYYKVDGTFTKDKAEIKGTLNTKFESIEEAGNFLERCSEAIYKVESIEQKEGSRFPAAPFTTSVLQQEAAHKLHFPVSTTMRIAQSLYERGLITYMRTDSTNLSSLALNTTKQFIEEKFGKEYSNPRQYKTKAKGAQEAHEAIRPTFVANTQIEGTPQEQKLYQLIWRRTVASQMADAKVLGTTVRLAVLPGGHEPAANEKFTISGTRVIFDGFLKVYHDEDASDSINLPVLKEGDLLSGKIITAECKFTQAPQRYSEATLVKKLEELGIGRPSTYAPTISTLTTGRGYIIKGDKEGRKVNVTNLQLSNGIISKKEKQETIGAEKGKLLPQDIGLIVTDYLVNNFGDIVNYDFTANVEKDFDSIADGEMEWKDVIGEFYKPFHTKVESSISDKQYSHVERELGTAPDGQKLVARFGQFGPYVQKGEGDSRQCASLGKDQLIENITIEDALRLFELPRTVGQFEGTDIIATKGRFGPYLKFGDRNVSLPRGTDPLSVSLEDCIKLIRESENASAAQAVIHEFPEADISVINGRYGPYIKHAGANYKIPRGTDAGTLTEEDCKQIIENAPAPSARKFRRFPKK